VGKYEAELASAGIAFDTFTRQLGDVDRCLCDGVQKGFVKISVRAGTDEILGATICGPNAGDMISELTVCMQYGIGVPQVPSYLGPYLGPYIGPYLGPVWYRMQYGIGVPQVRYQYQCPSLVPS